MARDKHHKAMRKYTPKNRRPLSYMILLNIMEHLYVFACDDIIKKNLCMEALDDPTFDMIGDKFQGLKDLMGRQEQERSKGHDQLPKQDKYTQASYHANCLNCLWCVNVF